MCRRRNKQTNKHSLRHFFRTDFDTSTRSHYAELHDGKQNKVAINDVFFALHALALTIVHLYQVSSRNTPSLVLYNVDLFCYVVCRF
jgi:hypothetical protein